MLDEADDAGGVTALAGWYGSNRLLGEHVGAALAGCVWVGVPFAGGMAEVFHMTARTIHVNDRHRWIINMARCVADDCIRPILIRRLERKAFHPDDLHEAQDYCSHHEPSSAPDPAAAEAYFVACWMGRGGNAGTTNEFNGGLSIRWNAGGGDSAVRYFSAVRALARFSKTLRRCTFDTLDCFEFLDNCQKRDADGHGIYCDAPFPGVGRRYKHNAGKTDAAELTWHTRLRDALLRFKRTRLVCRFYRHPLIEELYPTALWDWRELVGRKQSNDAAPELLLVRNAGTWQKRMF